MSQRIFIGLLGSTPSVISEALWALAFQLDPPVRVRAVRLLWTEGTMDAARTLLGRSGVLAQLKADYPKQMPWPVPPLDSDLGGHRVLGVQDVATQAQADAAAAGIYDYLRTSLGRRQRGEQYDLVVAGGRKTMTALAMAAFQLFARPEDDLWHVVPAVSDAEIGDRFYPRPGASRRERERFRIHRIPCLRVGHLIAGRGSIDPDRPFHEVLADLQGRLRLVNAEARVCLDFRRGQIRYAGRTIKPHNQRRSLALLATMKALAEAGAPLLPAGKGVHWSPRQLFTFLRYEALARCRGARDPLGRIETDEAMYAAIADRCKSACGYYIAPEQWRREEGPAADVLEEMAAMTARIASDLNVCVRRLDPPPPNITESVRRGAGGEPGTFRRLAIPPENVDIVTAGGDS